jgi:hypothetical protein
MHSRIISFDARGIPPLLLAAFAVCGHAGELRVSTDFEGGSARVESIDQEKRIVHMMPGGDPQHGWPCWWYLRVDGAEKDEHIAIDLGGSDLPARNNGKDTGKPLNPAWAMPRKAAFSTDGKTWQHTAPGRSENKRIAYDLVGTGGPLWIAWGPPFTPKDTEELIAWAEKNLPGAEGFELAKTRGGRPVRGIDAGKKDGAPAPHGIWLHARQHAWESGASWVGRGLIEWLATGDDDARWLRENGEIVLVPIMDVDNVATGNGGKEAAPRDHNRDWDAKPVYPEVAAAQQRLQEWAAAKRLSVFVDLHNPAPGDLQPFFFVGPDEYLDEPARRNRASFVESARKWINGPLPLDKKLHITGPGYHPLWRQMAAEWVGSVCAPHALNICLETSWNTPQSTTEGYRKVGEQLGHTIAEYLRSGPQR